MSRFESVLALAEFSPKSDNAVRRAALLARRLGVQLHLLHVVDPSVTSRLARLRAGRSNLEAKLERAYAALSALADRIAAAYQVHVRSTVRTGDTLIEVRQEASPTTLVVVGAKRGNPLRDFVLGSPTERLLRVLQRPMLVVKQAAEADYARVILPMEFSANGQAILRSTADALPATPLHLCHAVPEDREARLVAAQAPRERVRQFRDALLRKKRMQLESMLRWVRHRRVTGALARGDLASATLREQGDRSGDLIVVGKDGDFALGDFLLGYLAQHLLARATCDVLVLPRAALATAGAAALPLAQGFARALGGERRSWMAGANGPVQLATTAGPSFGA